MMTKQILGGYKERAVKSEYELVQDRLKEDPVMAGISDSIKKMYAQGNLEPFNKHLFVYVSKSLTNFHPLFGRAMVWLRGYVNYRFGLNLQFEIKKSVFDNYKWTIRQLEDNKVLASRKFVDNGTGDQALSDEFISYKYYFLFGKNDDVCCLFTDSKVAVKSHKFNWITLKPKGVEE